MRTLVTGACGFVGRYLVGELVSNGYEVLSSDIVEDHSARGAALQGVGAEGRGVPSISLPEGGEYRRCNLLDSEAVRELIEGIGSRNVSSILLPRALRRDRLKILWEHLRRM